MASLFTQIYEGNWTEWTRQKGNRLQCCDCSLTHSFDWRVVNGKLQMKMYRDNRATANCRRAAKKNDGNSRNPRSVKRK